MPTPEELKAAQQLESLAPPVKPEESLASAEVETNAEADVETEHASEQINEDEPDVLPENVPTSLPVSSPVPVAPPKDRLLQDIESAMQDGLEDAYRQLPPNKRAEFKVRGEKTAASIRVLLQAAHTNFKKIFQLLFDWLKLLPGVSRFFLEQEAKIKTDKILAAADEEHHRKNPLP